MFTALFSFLGGSAFRLIFGAVMDFANKKQEHDQEIASQKLQSQLEEQRHNRDMARIRMQSDLKVQEAKIMADAAISQREMDALLEAVRATSVITGVKWVDAWNQGIRPAGATVSLLIWVSTMIAAGFVLREFDETLIAAFLGVFVGERIHNGLRK